jgi:arylsulfatase A-like enzyme
MHVPAQSFASLLVLLTLCSCADSDVPPAEASHAESASAAPIAPAPTETVRLVDRFGADNLSGESLGQIQTPRTEWTFVEDAQGWQAGPDVADFAVSDGALRGRTAGESALLHVERSSEVAPDDPVHAIEVRGRVSAGSKISVRFQSEIAPGLPKARNGIGTPAWGAPQDIEPSDAIQTWKIDPPVFSSPTAADARHLILQPSDVAGAEFEIESVRVVFESEHLAKLESGRGWHGLANVFHDSLLLRAGQQASFEVVVPRAARLELELGTPREEPVSFRIDLASGGESTRLVGRTVTMPHRWERISADLSPWEGKSVTLSLSIAPDRPSALGFFGNPTLRPRHDPADPRPQGVIVFLGDTLRRHHLDAYGHPRETAPQLTRLAREGALFLDPIAQGSWTKVSTPSILTGLYQSSHGVKTFDDRLSAQATTLAEVFRDAGYATLGYSSVPFTGRFSNMHQGYETLHESTSVRADLGGPDVKTGRAYVDRLVEWLDDHPDTPFFVFLQAMDPHDPFEPRSPWATTWADPARRQIHLEEMERARSHIAHGFMRGRGLANPEELRAAGVEPDPHFTTNRDWYDGSIRGMDAELARVVERLETLGIADDVLIVFASDHGEEFGEHGEVFHGQSLYAEMIEVPLVFWGPGVASGVRVDRTVRGIDILPTVLELAGLPEPEGVQGRSLVPALRGEALPHQPAFSEKWLRDEEDPAVRRQGVESFAVVDERWKLIHNTTRTDGVPEFELYDRSVDPKDTTNLAEANPEELARLRGELDAWRQRVAEVAYDAREDGDGATADELEQLRALGYVE